MNFQVMHVTLCRGYAGLYTTKTMPVHISYKGTKSLKASWKRVAGNHIFINKQGSKHQFEAKAWEKEQTLKIIKPFKKVRIFRKTK